MEILLILISSYFYIVSPNVHFSMDSGVQFLTQHPYSGLIYFAGGGADNLFNLGTYNFSRTDASGAGVPAYITNFTSDSATPNVQIVPLNVEESTIEGILGGAQVGMSFPSIQVTSQHALSGTRYACFDIDGNLISSAAPCSGR